MDDVKDILGLQSPQQSSASARVDSILSPKKIEPKKKKIRKPEGVRREVFMLHLENGTLPTLQNTEAPTATSVPLMQSPTALPYKEKRKVDRKVTPWVWKGFHNPARKDNLVLSHWVKEDEQDEPYSFSRFHSKITMYDYTDEQYNKYFNNDPNWTREDTDALWKLCKEFDVRFVVVHDRFPNPNKTIEDLKERYYKMMKKLVEINALPEEDVSKHPLVKFNFNKAHEEQRKQQFEKLYNRTKEQIEEEKMLIQEYKRIEQQLMRHQKQKKRVLQLSDTALNATPGTPVAAPEERRGRGRRKIVAMPVKDEEYVEEPLSPQAAPETPTVIKGVRKEKATGAYMRSNNILTPLQVSNKMMKRIDEFLIEVGIGLRPMPTATICKVFNEIRQDIVALLDLQKHLSQKEYAVQLLRDQRQNLINQVQSGQPLEPFSPASVPKPATPMSIPATPDPTMVLDPLGISPLLSEKKRQSQSKLDKKMKKRKKDKNYE